MSESPASLIQTALVDKSPFCLSLSTVLSVLTSHQPFHLQSIRFQSSPLPGSALWPWSLPLGCTMKTVFVLELSLLLPQWSARSCSPQLLYLPKEQKQPKPLSWDSKRELRTGSNYQIYTRHEVDSVSNTMVSQYHRGLPGCLITPLEHHFQAGFHPLKGKGWKLKSMSRRGW